MQYGYFLLVIFMTVMAWLGFAWWMSRSKYSVDLQQGGFWSFMTGERADFEVGQSEEEVLEELGQRKRLNAIIEDELHYSRAA